MLELLAGAGLPGAGMLLDLAFGRCLPLGLGARGHLLKTMFLLDLPHDYFLSTPVLRVADHLAAMRDPVRHDVNMLMISIVVPGHHVLVIREPHPANVSLADLPPLVIREMLARRRRQGDVHHRLAQIRAQLTNRAEF